MEVRSRTAAEWALTVIVVAGLAIDAYVHLDLASLYAANRTSVLSEADLFRAEAAVAVVAALALLLHPRRYTAAFALVVAAAGTAAVVVYRYVDIPAFGPFPAMYDPFWGPAEKTASMIAEALATLAALALLVTLHRQSRLVAARSFR